MPVGDDTFAYRSRLPHLIKRDPDYAVAFCTRRRRVLPPGARDIVLESCVREHQKRCWLHCAVVMPDHVHLVVKPYDEVLLTKLVGQIKGRSAFFIKVGPLWQRDEFDRIVRAGEDLEKKIRYVCDNPVRKGIVMRCEDYPWLWRSWIPAG